MCQCIWSRVKPTKKKTLQREKNGECHVAGSLCINRTAAYCIRSNDVAIKMPIKN